jgi:hypothetical protein
MLMVIPDPDRVTSSAPQDIPDHGVTVPCALADTPYTRKEWEELIKAGAPVLVKDVKAATAADGGDD